MFVCRTISNLLICLTDHDMYSGSMVEKVFLNRLSFYPNTANTLSSCHLNLVPLTLNARLMSLPAERISQHVPATLVMPRLVKDKVCASQHSVTPVFHVFFIAPTNQITTDIFTGKGK